jgi:type I restriction enzyme S subunit
MVKTTTPAEWKYVKLSIVADKCTTKNREFAYSLVLTNSAQHGVIPQSEHFDKDIAVNENIDGYFVINDGEFVYNPRISTAAPCGPIRRNHSGETGIVSPLYTVFRLKEGKIDDSFAEYYFFSSAWYKYAKSIANYGVRHDRMAISDADFFSMPIPLPPLTEQCAVAEILTTQDRLITAKTRLIDAKKQQKRWLMQNLLTGKVRLPRFKGEWPRVKLREIGEWRKGSGISKEEAKSGNIPAIRYGELYTVHDEYVKCYYSFISENVAASSVKLNKGDLLFTCSGETKEDIGKSVAFLDDCIAYAGGDLIILSPNSAYSSQYLGFALNSSSIVKQKARVGQGDSIVHISAESLKKITFNIPPLVEQTAIAERLTAADREIELLSRELEQQKLVKKYLMQQLLTGKMRVKGANV